MRILNKKEVKKIENKINGIYNSDLSLSKSVVLEKPYKKEIWISSKDIFKTNLNNLNIFSIGMYLGRIEKHVKLSVEGSQLVGATAKKNVCEIENVWDFIRGFKIEPTKKIKCDENQYVIVRYNENVVGSAKLKNNQLESILPKNRKIKSLTKRKMPR